MTKLFVKEADTKKITGLKGYRLFFHQKRKKSILKLISKTHPIGSTVLDVGCAFGDISTELSLRGYKVHGIDFEGIRLSKARDLANKYQQRIVFENISFQELENLKIYDVVLLGEVLEHFVEPVNTLKKIKHLLKPEGKVVVTVPNMPGLRNRLKFGILGIFPDNNLEHKYHFDFRRFSEVVSAADYELLHFNTRFTNVFQTSKFISMVEDILLLWFSFVFPKSGDTIFAVISPKYQTISKQ